MPGIATLGDTGGPLPSGLAVGVEQVVLDIGADILTSCL